MLIFNVPFFVYALATNHLYSDGKSVGILNDINYILLNFISVPSNWAFYLWLPYAISRVIQKLENSKIITNGESRFSEKIQEFSRTQNKPIWFITTLLTVLSFQLVFLFPQHLNFKNMIGTNFLVLILYEILYFPTYYITVITAVRIIIFSAWLSKVFSEHPIKLFSLHPDGVGGIGFIGEYASRTGYLIGIWGFSATVVILTEGYQLQTGNVLYFTPLTLIPLVIYLVLAPLAFFVPLWKIHLAMKRTRDEQLEKIAKQFDDVLLKITQNYKMDTDVMKSYMDRLGELEKLNSLVLKSPVYPFRTPDFINYSPYAAS